MTTEMFDTMHGVLQDKLNQLPQMFIQMRDQNKRGRYNSPHHSHTFSPEASPIALHSSPEHSQMDMSGATVIEHPPPLPQLDIQEGGWHNQLANASIGFEDDSIHVPPCK